MFEMRFAGDTDYEASASGHLTVKVLANLSTPRSPYLVRHGHRFTVYGFLKPRHTAGTHPVVLYCYRLEHGHWVLRKKVSMHAYDSPGGKSKYVGYVTLPYAGRWRLQARHADSVNGVTLSSYRYIHVR